MKLEELKKKYRYVLKVREEIYLSGVQEVWNIFIGSQIKPIKIREDEDETEDKYGHRHFKEVYIYLIKQQGQLYAILVENEGNCQGGCEGMQIVYILHSSKDWVRIGVGKEIDYVREKQD